MVTTELKNPRIDQVHVKEAIPVVSNISTCLSRSSLAALALDFLVKYTGAFFGSFVEKESNSLKVVCQIGDSTYVKKTFTRELCLEIFNWVTSKKKLAVLNLEESDQFMFVPVTYEEKGRPLVCGLFVLYCKSDSCEVSSELKKLIDFLGKIVSLSLANAQTREISKKHFDTSQKCREDSELVTKLRISISNNKDKKKISIKTLQNEDSISNDNFYWIDDSLEDSVTLLVCQTSAMNLDKLAQLTFLNILSSYVIGIMNGLRAKTGMLTEPREVLSYLNKKLYPVFRSTGVSINAWYGVFNINERRVNFVNANYPAPYLIGLEQQIIKLEPQDLRKGNSLGIDLSSEFSYGWTSIYSGSKLVICNQELIDKLSMVGSRYDPTWIVQLLETLGSLSLTQLKNNLENILSENYNGTVKEASRLALLLEIPS